MPDDVVLPFGFERRVFQDLPAAGLVTDGAGWIVSVNHAFTLTTGYSEGELLGKNCRLLQGSATDSGTVATIRAALEAGRPFRGEILNYRKDGGTFWNLLSIAPLPGPDGGIAGFVSVQLDVTADRQHRELLTEQSETNATLLGLARRLSTDTEAGTVAQTVADTVLQLGAERCLVALVEDASDTARVTAAAGLGHLTERAVGRTVPMQASPELQSMIAEPKPMVVRRGASQWADDMLTEFESTGFGLIPIHSGSRLRGVFFARWIGVADDDVIPPALLLRLEGIAGLAAVALDNVELIEHIRRAAQTDQLTGLSARAVVHERLASELLAASDGHLVGILSCDVDHFKWINDALGHAGGDEALKQLAQCLRAVMPAEATIGRPGGDEFIAVLPHLCSQDELDAHAHRLEQHLRHPLTIEGQEVYLSLSIGTALGYAIPPDHPDESADALLRDADTAMYRIKEQRHGRGHTATGLNLLQLDTELHHALDRGEIIAYFQPQYELRTGRLSGYEALARWHHPVKGVLTPDRFLQLAENDGLIHDLGHEILRQACRFAETRNQHGPLTIEVNLSSAELNRPGLASRVSAVLEQYPNRRWSLTLEVTEAALILNRRTAAEALTAIRALGVGVAIDDFGTGYSSLAQLQDLPATELKIDKSLVQREGAVGASVLATIVSLGRNLRLDLVAEGVETREQLLTLRRLGCDRAQGFLLAPPRPRTPTPPEPTTIDHLIPARDSPTAP